MARRVARERKSARSEQNKSIIESVSHAVSVAISEARADICEYDSEVDSGPSSRSQGSADSGSPPDRADFK